MFCQMQLLYPRAMVMSNQREDVKSKSSRVPTNDMTHGQDQDQMDLHRSEDNFGQAARPSIKLASHHSLQTVSFTLPFSYHQIISSLRTPIPPLYQQNPPSHPTNPPPPLQIRGTCFRSHPKPWHPPPGGRVAPRKERKLNTIKTLNFFFSA